MTDPKTLISRYPLTAEACKLEPGYQWPRWQVANRVRRYAEDMSIGDYAYDSVESLMAAIESHLAASRPKPLTEEDVAKMRWNCHWGTDLDSQSASLRTHNADIDRLWAECKRLTAELEARR